MPVPLLVALDPVSIIFPGGSQAVFMLLRWIHFIAGIIWIGLLYFFVLVNAPFLGSLDTATRIRVIPELMSRALWWFRWSSVVTVLAGFAYWNSFVAADARSAQAVGGTASPGRVIGSFVIIWTIAFALEMGFVMSPVPALKRGPVFGVLVAIVLVVAGYIFLALNEQGWESQRTLAIGIGGGLGWFMMFNVWGLVWRMQKKLLQWTKAAATDGSPMPPEAAQLAQTSMLIARLSFWVSFPMLFFMGVSSHYAMFVQK